MGDLTPIAGAALADMVDTLAYRHFVFGEPPGAALDLPGLSYALTALWYHAIYSDEVPAVRPSRSTTLRTALEWPGLASIGFAKQFPDLLPCPPAPA
jgi:hypothetical protein